MAMRDALNTLWLVALFAAAIFFNDVVMERRMGNFLSTHPEIVLNALAQAQSQHANASATRMQQNLSAHWDVLSQTHAYAVRFNGSQFTSRLVRIGDVAKPKNLNLLVTDYRCGYCKADRTAVDALLRGNPNRDFVFIEAAILGPDSVELAKEALQRAQDGEADYYVIHNRQFDAPDGSSSSSEHGHTEDALLAEQKRFLEIVGVFATPTYIRDGVFRSGTIGTPDG
jgi:protein-disulfide isomerase